MRLHVGTNFVTRAVVYLLLTGLPALLALGVALWVADFSLRLKLTLFVPALLAWLGTTLAAREFIIRNLQTLANVLGALREGDFSLRARSRGRDAMNELVCEINTLSNTLQRQRRSETEATHLLTTVVEEIDAAVFAFDSDHRLRLINPHGVFLLGCTETPALGTPADTLGLRECLEGSRVRVLPPHFLRKPGRWGLRRNTFYAEGKPHQLLLISDLSQPLRDEEQVAWQRLVRVLTHELNNSLTPIKSIAGSLLTRTEHATRDPEWESDLRRGLEIIEGRADGLRRFTEGYAQLARLPDPVARPLRLPPLLARIQHLDTRLPVLLRLEEGLPEIRGDADQLEQALINLVRNAIDAALAEPGPEGPRVWLTARGAPGAVEITITDNGHGIANATNLFVPFFTTKPKGSGIGLVLARQVIEKHQGKLSLRNEPTRGCSAVVSLPL